ncbi:transcriptional regulator [Candidatus Riflebacteria bacterium]
MYALSQAPVTEYQSLIEVAKKIPNGVICLVSALVFHSITTELPHEIWIAVPRNTWRPEIDYPSIRYTALTKSVYSYGIEKHTLNGVIVKVYSPAKTVADCFKFRNKIGLDVAIEGLKETWRAKKTTMNELYKAAQVNRVSRVMQPYLEAMV